MAKSVTSYNWYIHFKILKFLFSEMFDDVGLDFVGRWELRGNWDVLGIRDGCTHCRWSWCHPLLHYCRSGFHFFRWVRSCTSYLSFNSVRKKRHGNYIVSHHWSLVVTGVNFCGLEQWNDTHRNTNLDILSWKLINQRRFRPSYNSQKEFKGRRLHESVNDTLTGSFENFLG